MATKHLFRALFLSLILFCCTPISAKDNWLSVKSKNFTLIGNASESDMRKVATKLEQFRQALSVIFPKLQVDTPIPTTVIIFKADDSFRPFKPRYKGKINDKVGGYFLTGPEMNYIVFANENRGDENPYDIIFHEYEHFIVRNNLFRLPAWLDEGLAEFYSSFEISDKDQKGTLGSPISRHVYNLRNATMVPLKTLFSVDHKSPYYNESSKAGIFYAESWALVHYLILGNDQKRQSQLIKFIDLIQNDVPTEQGFREAFQADYQTLEDELRPYLNRSLYPVVRVNFKQRLSTDHDIVVRPISEAEAEYYLGDLLLQSNRLEEAESHLQKSVTVDAAFAAAHVALGELRSRQDRGSEASEEFETAIRLDQNNYLAHYLYGRTLYRETRLEEAIKQYQTAITLNPRMGFVYLSLAYAYLASGEDSEAVDTLGRGVGADPKNPLLYRSLGFILLQQARGEVAVYNASTYLRIKGWLDDASSYMALVKYFGLRQTKKDAEAARFVIEAGLLLDASEWPYPLVQYLEHKLPIDQLFAKASDNEKLTEAHAYVGLEFSLNGDRASAAEHLQWVRDHGRKDFVEYLLALAELARIEQTP